MQATRVLKPQLDGHGAHAVLSAAVTNSQRLLVLEVSPDGSCGAQIKVWAAPVPFGGSTGEAASCLFLGSLPSPCLQSLVVRQL